MGFGLSSAVAALVLMFAVISVARGIDPDNDFTDANWQAFKARFGKQYSSLSEENSRRAMREMNMRTIKEHNDAANQGQHTFTLGENEFSDWTPAEYRKMLGYKPSSVKTTTRRRRQASQPPMPVYSNTVSLSTLPTTVNWTTAGWVGPVMNQGQCGSCWSYSSAGAIEAQYMNYTNTWVQLSEQNLIDCSSAKGNMGCNGGNIDDAFWYVQTNGIESLAAYPDVSNITGVSNSTCMFNPSQSVTSVVSWRNVLSGSEDALQQAVALAGPVSAAIDASLLSFQYYRSGVYAPTGCNPDTLDHAILVVGYGVSNGLPYWLIQNSWGTSWGINGYMMMARDSNNMCGIASAASFPVLF